MKREQIELVRSSWRELLPIADSAMQLFYRRLFEIDPGLERHFAAVDMDRQRAKLLSALDAVVGSLDDFDSLRPKLDALGKRHVGYGASREHYDSVGEALLWTLQQGLGAAWNESACEAWGCAYGLISETMQQAATEVETRFEERGLPREQGLFQPGIDTTPEVNY